MLSIIGNFLQTRSEQPALLGINLSGDAGSPKPSLLWRSEGWGWGGWNRSIHTDLSLCQWSIGKNIFRDLLKPSWARRETRPRFVKRVAGRPFPATAATISLSLNTLCVVLRREGYVCLKRVVCSGLGRRGGGGVFLGGGLRMQMQRARVASRRSRPPGCGCWSLAGWRAAGCWMWRTC